MLWNTDAEIVVIVIATAAIPCRLAFQKSEEFRAENPRNKKLLGDVSCPRAKGPVMQSAMFELLQAAGQKNEVKSSR